MFDTTSMESVEAPATEQTTEESSAFMDGFMEAGTDGPEMSEPVTEEPETTEESTSAQPDLGDTIAYTYNHATTQLPRSAVTGIASALKMDENALITMLQKGNNYDTLVQRQQTYVPLINAIQSYARDNGIGTDAALKKVMDAFSVVSSERYARDIRKQFPNAAPAMVQELARNRAAQAAQAKAREDAQSQAEAAENQRREQWVSFFKAHPDVTSESLSPRMLEALSNNENPELVFAQEQIANLTKMNDELRQKTSNAARSPGSARQTSGSKPTSDFMAGFFGK
jgi:hypothetical protein